MSILDFSRMKTSTGPSARMRTAPESMRSRRRETGRRGQSDESQLEWASAEGRLLVTFNVAHFAWLHADWLRQGRHHAGIVVSSQRSIGDVVRRLRHLAVAAQAESLRDRLEFLGDW